MRWQKYAILLCLIVLTVALVVETAKSDMTSDSANITVYAYPKFGMEAPLNFTATFISPQQVNLEWTKDPTANYTVIRAKFYDYPESATDGYLVYRGEAESANDTFLDLDLTFGPVFYGAWSENATDNASYYSTEYAYASVENPEMEGIVDQLTSLNNFLNGDFLSILTFLFEILLLLGFFAVALWRQDMILFLVSGLVTAIIGSRWVLNYPGITIIMWALATYELLRAVLMAIEAGGPSKGWSQIKGLYSRLRGKI